ncbi:MAG: hypothetical protein ACREM6_08030, partial [Vulcanimicrobiaceae bacterium]
PPRGPHGEIYGSATPCDDLSADGTLGYYGLGSIKVTWTLDGVALGSHVYDVSSPEVQNLGRKQTTAIVPLPGQKAAIPGTEHLAPDSFLPTNTVRAAPFRVQIAVDVVPDDVTSPTIGARLTGRGASLAAVAQAATSVPPAAPKLGYLPPFQNAVRSLPSIAFAVAPPAQSPSHVTSNEGLYTVGTSDSQQPCRFVFRTQQGDFTIAGLQHNVTKSGTHYNGRGTLVLTLVTDDQGAVQRAVPIAISNWNVPGGSLVTSGTIDVASPASEQSMPYAGTTASLVRLRATTDGTPSRPLLATMKFALSDSLLRAVGGSGPPSFAPIEAPLDSDGNWISAGETLPSTEIGNSGFILGGSNVVFDYSLKTGAPASGACDASDPSFVGVNLGTLNLQLNTLNITGSQTPIHPANWVVDAKGLCGNLSADPNFRAQYDQGFVSIPHVEISVAESQLSATYKDMDVHVPWLGADLRGDATIVTSGTAQLALTTAPVEQNYGPITMAVDDIAFGSVQGHGWVVFGNAHFDFRNGAVAFTHADVDNVIFTLGGRPLFGKGSTTADIALGNATKFNQTPLDLRSLHLSAARSGSDQLAFDFDVGARISQSLPESETHVHYDIHSGGSGFVADQPTMDPFQTEVALPLAQPAVDSKMTPQYRKTPSGDDQYYGDVDMASFGGPPVKAQFLLGFTQGSDYWTVRGDVGFPAPGIVVAPGVGLYQLGGGMGYHVKIGNPEDLKTASFDPNSDLTFLAGMQLGSPDNAYAYWFDGQLKIVTGTSVVRLDYAGTILSSTHTVGGTGGVAEFDGYLQWAAGDFDGRLEGQVQPPGLSAIYARVPGPHYGGGDYAGGFHFGEGSWDVYLGTKPNPITGHIVIADFDSWFDLGSKGLDVGAGESINFGVGGAPVGASISGSFLIELVITPQPHIAGDASAQLSISFCLGVCFGLEADANVHVEALPIEASGRAHVHIGMPWPIPDIDLTVSASV